MEVGRPGRCDLDQPVLLAANVRVDGGLANSKGVSEIVDRRPVVSALGELPRRFN